MEGGIFPGMEFVPGGCPGGSLPVSSELLNMLLHVRPGRWWRGDSPPPPGDGVCPRRTSGGSLTVSSELLNMLLLVRPGRWRRGNLSGEGVRSGRFSGENGGCLYVNSN